MINTHNKTEKAAEQLKQLINEITEDLRPQVEAIESGLPTGQNNYQAYYAVISRLGNGDRTKLAIVAVALVKAGANEQGVYHGLKTALGV